MSRQELSQLAGILAEWANHHPVIACVYLFGSRVRGDYNQYSDVDIFVDFVKELDGYGTDLWGKDVDDDFSQLKVLLPGPLSIHIDKSDKALPEILRAAKTPILQIGKVVCVLTPRRP